METQEQKTQKIRVQSLNATAPELSFTAGDAGKNKTYPLEAILDAISIFNSGHSLSDTQQLIRRRLHVQISERTISSWIAEYRQLATYARLGQDAKALFAPGEMVRTYELEHCQVDRFQVHQAKLDLLINSAGLLGLDQLKHYFESVGPRYLHHPFTKCARALIEIPR